MHFSRTNVAGSLRKQASCCPSLAVKRIANPLCRKVEGIVFDYLFKTTRHCETSPQTGRGNPFFLNLDADCHVAALLAMTRHKETSPFDRRGFLI